MTISKGPQAFPRSEYLRRLAAVKSEMARRGVETLVVSFDRNMNYLAGYTARTAYVPQGLVVSMRQDEPTIILRLMDTYAAHYQTFLVREHVIGYPEALIGNAERDGYDAIIDFLQETGAASAGLGLELANLPPSAVDKFKARLPNINIADFSNVVTWIRTEKSDLEIAYMKEAAAITDAGIRRAAEVIRPGVWEADAAAEIVAALMRGTNGKHGTSVANFWMNTSPRIGASHFTWSEDVFREGSQINLEIAGVRHNYTVPISRTFSIGKPSERLRRVHEAQVNALDAALSVVSPGRTCHEVAEVIYGTLAKHGVEKESRCGYAIGIDWLESTASIRTGDMTQLKPNMTFHLHLGNWLDEDFGVMVSESIRVTESGVEVLTGTPRQLFEL
ncbi:M24 family metallopeptidase [Paraburkholderia phenoliruptrix]|uniref:M24 family metallopeptidase n=1 Tax=Paraburkholderia phenoliruptrix TaxID=252970 RepID=UPI002869C77F|nr:Xaa-Pro peptidase family protein [Paraburkholderia phenoliruptrix]WMY11050.1 Xaa-Pro peptidase family protein [Paraburkholderia phenoliruptrix]